MIYNIDRKMSSANVSLKVKDVPHGKRDTKNTFYIRGKRADIFCGIPSNLSICKSTSVEETVSKIFAAVTPEYLLSLGGPTSITFLFYNCRDRTLGSPNIPKAKRTFSSIDRIGKTSGDKGNERLSAEANAARFDSDRKNTRCNKAKDDAISEHSNSRFRFQCSYGLRSSRVGRGWIQSFQTWQAFISPDICFRESSQSQSQRRIAAGKKERQKRGYTIYRYCSEKDSIHNSKNKNSHQSRCGILLLANDKLFRRRRIWFCNGSAGDKSHKDEVAGAEIPHIQSSTEVSDCSVPVPTSWMEKGTPFYSDEISVAQRTGKQTANAADNRPLRVSCICDQSGFESGKHLVFLQWPGRHRDKYQRAKERLFYEQDSNEKVFRKPSPSEAAASGFRFISLVPDIMFTATSSIQDITMGSQACFDNAGEIRNSRTSKYSEISDRFLSRSFDKTDIQQRRKSEVFAKIGQFANDCRNCSDEAMLKNGVFPHFLGLNLIYFPLLLPS